MTTEDDFQCALDEQPDAHHLRLVFADWLQERGDPRAEGYRAIVSIGRLPLHDTSDGKKCWFRESSAPADGADCRRLHRLPEDWFELLEADLFGEVFHHWINFDSRREAEDAAALAFARLPAERRAELLAARQPAETP